MTSPFDLWGRGWSNIEVVGESHHARAIRGLLGADLKSEGSEIRTTVQLKPDPLNTFDRNAVGVWSGNRQLGNLSREDASRYVPVLSALVSQGWVPQVPARIWAADWSHLGEGEGFTASVRLDLAEPHLLMPVNQPPVARHQMLPVGNAIQVTGEEHHLDALSQWLRPEGECWVYATLHEITEQLPRSTRTVVEVRIDGVRVGQLTPKMSGDLLAAIRHLDSDDLVTAARAMVKGNRIKAEVVLYTVRAHELPDEWLSASRSEKSATTSAVSTVPTAVPVPPGSAPVAAPEQASVQARRSEARFAAPPNWPQPPPGWQPGPGWVPDPAWGPPPPGWQMWVDSAASPVMPAVPTQSTASPRPTVPAQAKAGVPVIAAGSRPGPPPPPAQDLRVPLFGARAKARELVMEVTRLRAEVDGQAADVTRIQAELDALRAEMSRLGVLSTIELEQYRERLGQEIADKAARFRSEEEQLQERIGGLRRQVVVTEETALLQEAGIYEYRHPLSDAVSYQGHLAKLQEQIKAMAKVDGGAILAAGGWTVNGSQAQGRTMLRDYSKLMLRAYNAEADNLVRGLKPYRVDAAIERLDKVAATIARLGKTMDIRVAEHYHRLRVKELTLTADYLQKVADEKEREKEEKARLREERRVQQEIDRERARLDKERQHYANALAALQSNGDTEGSAQLLERLSQIDNAIRDVDYRAANVRAGYVYVISNLGAFGEKMIKVGMTRRLDPLDRVRELSDASVPFNFDVHALFFSEDALGIEAEMHARLAARRVNLVNQRREFFYATPEEAKQHLIELTGSLLQYDEMPEALEYRQSLTQANSGGNI